jgi:hypothetical protein
LNPLFGLFQALHGIIKAFLRVAGGTGGAGFLTVAMTKNFIFLLL